MDAAQILALIEEHNLSIRRFPDKVITLCEITYSKPGDEIVEPKGWNRKMVRRTRIPEHAGWYMCQSVRHTYSRIEWTRKSHNLAPTLEESIKKYLGENEH